MSNRRHLNLDESRKARHEKAEPPAITLGGREFILPAAPPLQAFVAFAQADAGELSALPDALELLFGAEADAILKLGLDLDDLKEILNDLYGEDLGEASASGGSSSSTSDPSRRTSKASTAST